MQEAKAKSMGRDGISEAQNAKSPAHPYGGEAFPVNPSHHFLTGSEMMRLAYASMVAMVWMAP